MIEAQLLLRWWFEKKHSKEWLFQKRVSCLSSKKTQLATHEIATSKIRFKQEDTNNLLSFLDPTTIIDDSIRTLYMKVAFYLLEWNLNKSYLSSMYWKSVVVSWLQITELNRGLQTRLKVNHRNITARLEDCQDVKLLQPDLYFGIKTEESGPRKLPPLTNLTWSKDILRPILCVSFVGARDGL